MKTIEILGANCFPRHSRIRVARRGIVVNDGKLLLSYEAKNEQRILPDGDLEPQIAN